ncbi:MAG TPA: T9SS type A sorting domain-containing protein [Bacteroidia bacterium]|nr:T9SS type A sorting domain-containing protein [Bacteroidia bacterium]
MKKITTQPRSVAHITALALLCFIALTGTIKKARSQAWTGASLFGTTGMPEWGKAVCLDASGNYYVTGVFQGTTTFNNGKSVTSAGVGDVFVAKFNSAGTCQWAVRCGGTLADGTNVSAGSICTDGSSVYFGSQFQGTGATFGATTLNSAGSTDAFVAKLNASTGTYLWAVSWGGTSFNDNCQSLILDPSGNLYACGNFTGSGGIGTNCNILGINALANGISEACVVKINPATGAAVWVASGGSTASADNNNGSGICYVAGLNEIVFTGSATSTASGQTGVYGATTIPLVFTSVANTDIVLAEINASTGAWVSAKGLITGSGVNDDGLGIVALSNGRCILTGFFQNTIQFPGNAALNSLGNDDMFLASYNPSTDVFNWSVSGGGASGQERSQAIASDNFGSVFVSGWYTGTGTFGTKNLPDISGGGNNNAFLLQYDETNGNCLMALGAGGSTSGGAKGYGIAASVTGNHVVYWAGQAISNPVGTGGTVTYGTFNVSPAAITPNVDIVIAKASAFVIFNATQSQINASCFGMCNGSAAVAPSGGVPPYSYLWSPPVGTGSTASSLCAGNYTCTITDNSGSSVVKNFTITQPAALNVSISGNSTVCSGISVQWCVSGGVNYIWSNGANTNCISVSTTGTYTVTVTNTSGCTGSGSKTLTVNALPSATITAGGTTTFCSGDSVVLSAPGGANRTYQWKKGTNLISGDTSSSYTATAGGNYRVIVTNTVTGCSKTTASATAVTVNPLPNATITPQGPTTFCAGGSVLLKGNYGAGFTYQWKKGGNNIAGATLKNYTATIAGTYKIEVTNSNGCSKLSGGVTVTVPCKLNESESESAFDVKVYPNPAHDKLTVSIYVKEPSNLLLQLTDITGRIVFSENESSIEGWNTYQPGLNHLSKGVYMLEVKSGSESWKTKVVVE